MDILKFTEKTMSMNDATWARHASPWSVYTRFTALPLISLAFWSREWIDWFAIVPIALSMLWVWLNPRVFPAPEKTNNWASMGTFGERIYLNRKNVNIPQHHLSFCTILQVLPILGVPFFIYGLYALDFWSLLLGNLWIMVCKTWFVDRMVWVFMDMKDANAVYQSWLKD